MKKFLEKNRQKKLKIHCVGDAMIDEYYQVEITRISPEHPVPVMACQNNFIRKPGGASNVAYQFKHLNADVSLICFPDDEANQVYKDHNLKLIRPEFEINSSLPVKRRYLDNGIQVAPRHDFEKNFCGLNIQQIKEYLHSLSFLISKEKPDVAILSDYNKGFFASNDNSFLKIYKDTKTIVDPKCGPLEKWKGCNIFKPNYKEAEQLSGKSLWQDQAKFLYDFLECESVVITFGGEKVAGIWDGQEFVFKPYKKVNVKSVIGAGDCFAAFFATAIGHGFNPIEASEIAWTAGSIYVQQRMNRPVVPAELSDTKIVVPEDLEKRDFKLVFTNGCFDILHKGHIETLKFSKNKGDKLVVALNSDASIKRIKDASRPILPLEHRLAVIAALEFVDFVVSFDDDDPLNIIKTIKPDVLVKGCGYDKSNILGANLVPEVYVAPSVENSSTTIFADQWLQRKSLL